MFGTTIDTVAAYEGRLLGAAYVGYALVNFLTRGSVDLVTRRAIVAANVVAWGIGFVVLALAQREGLSNSLGWTSVTVAAAFTVAWAWTYAAERRGPESQRVPARP